jgi:hypothetical protein
VARLATTTAAGVLTLMPLIPMILERATSVDTLTATFVLLAWSATTSFAAIGARWLPLSPRMLLVGGLIGCAVGQLSVYGLKPDSSILRLLPGMLLAGAANRILNAALGHLAVAGVPPDRSAMGSGANNTARYLGSATGLTICAVIITHGAQLPAPPGFWPVGTTP